MHETEKRQTNIFKNVEFDNVRLRVCELITRYRQHMIHAGYRKLDYISISEFAGSNIKKSVTIEGEPDAVNQVLPKVYEVGLQDKLIISYDYHFSWKTPKTLSLSYNIPYTKINEKIFDKSYFTNCDYGKRLLQYAKSTVYTLTINNNKKVVLIIRGFQITLSAIKNAIDEEQQCKICNFKNIDIIRVYAYNIDIDIDPNEVSTDRKEIEFNFMYAGSNKKSLLGRKTEQRTMTINYEGRSNREIKIKYEDLPMRFIDIYKSWKNIPDPIIVRAFTTCLLVNLDSSYDDALKSPTETNPNL